MPVLSDAQWAELKAVLDEVRSGEGRRFQDGRQTVEAVIWRLRNGARWRAVPIELGPWWRAAQRPIRWSRKGTWAKLFTALRDRGRPDLAEVFLDGTNVRAHAKAAGAKGGAAERARAQSRRLWHPGLHDLRRARPLAGLCPPTWPGA